MAILETPRILAMEALEIRFTILWRLQIASLPGLNRFCQDF